MSEPANKSIYTCSDSRKAREICWSTAILQMTIESVFPYKPPCALPGLHTSYFSSPFLAPVLTEPGFISLPVSYCCANWVAPSLRTLISCGLPSCSPLSSHLCLLPSLSSASGFTCSAHLLTAFHFATHTQLHHTPSSLSFPNTRLSCPHLPLSLHLVPSASPSICTLFLPHSQSQLLCLP